MCPRTTLECALLGILDYATRVTPGSTMGPTNALSHLTDPDISSNNTNITLLPDDLFIHAINTALVDKITSSTPTDLLVHLYFLVLPLLIGISLTPVFTLKTVSTYLLSPAMTSYHQFTHPSLLAMEGSSAPIPYYLGTTGGRVCLPSSAVLSLGVPFANR